MAQSIALAPNHECAEGLLGRAEPITGTQSPAEKTEEKQAGFSLWPHKAFPLETAAAR
jgi:hypothetical protein